MIFRFGQKHCRLEDVVVDMLLLLYTSASGGSCRRGSYVGNYYKNNLGVSAEKADFPCRGLGYRYRKDTFHVEHLVTGIEKTFRGEDLFTGIEKRLFMQSNWLQV